MPSNNILQLLIESKTTGTSDIDNLSSALNRLAAVGEQTARTLENSTRGIDGAGQAMRKLGQEANSTGFNLRYAFFGLKDLAEGRTKFAIAEAANEMTRLRGAAFAIGGAVAVVAGVAFAIYEMKKRAEEAAEAPHKIAVAFGEIIRPIRQSNDELELANAKLQNEIAKLEGKPENNLRVALHEAALEADRLADSLDQVFDKAVKAFEKFKVGPFSLGHLNPLGAPEATTPDIDERIKNFQQQLTGATATGNLAIHQATARGDNAAVKKAQEEMRLTINRMIEKELVDYVYPEEGATQARTQLRTRNGPGSVLAGAQPGEDVVKRLGYLRGYESLLQETQRGLGDRTENATLNSRKDQLEATRANTEAALKLQAVIDRYNAVAQGPGSKLLELIAQFERDLRQFPAPQATGKITQAFVGATSRELVEENKQVSKEAGERANYNAESQARLWQEATDGLKRYDQEVVKTFNQQATTAREIRNVNLGTERQGIERQAGRQQRLSELNAAPGTEGQIQAANEAYRTRLALAQQLRAIDIDTAHQELDINKQRVDLVKAEADYRRQAQDAELERELRLTELAKRRTDEFKNLAVEFVNSAESHGLPAFFKQQGQKIQNQVVSNAAGEAFKFIPNLSVTKDSNSFLGKLLAGTPFGAKAADPMTKAAEDTAKYTKDTRDILYTMATGQASGTVGSAILNAGAGGSGITIPGLAKFGSDTNGITGNGPLGAVGGFLNFLKGGSSSSSDSDLLPGLIGVTKGQLNSAKGNAFSTLFNSDASTGSRIGAGLGIAGAGFGAYQGISQATKGGAKNIASGIGTTLMSVGAFTGPAAPFVEAAGAIASMIGAFLPDPRQQRQNDINRRLAADQFYTPVAINATMGTNGSAYSTNRFGQLQALDTSPYPQVQEPYADLRNGITVPGRTNSPIGGPSGINPGPAMPPVTIYAMDSQSFADFAHSNRGAIADASGAAVLSGHGEQMIQAVAARMR